MIACFGGQDYFINSTPFYRLFQDRLDNPSPLSSPNTRAEQELCLQTLPWPSTDSSGG